MMKSTIWKVHVLMLIPLLIVFLYLPAEGQITLEIKLPVNNASVRVTNTVPTDYEGTIESWEEETVEGKVFLTLTDAPLIIEELPVGGNPPPGGGLPYENSPFGYYPRSEGRSESDTWQDRYADAVEAGIR